MQRARLPIISAAGVAALLLVASVGTVAADTGPAITIPPAFATPNAPTLSYPSTARLVNGVSVTIPVDIVCQPMPSDWDPSVDPTIGHIEQAGAQIIQAISKKSLAAGQGGGGADVVCDGSTVNHLDLVVVATTAPFRKGSAVMGLQIPIANADYSKGGYRSTGPLPLTLTSK